MAEVIKIKKGLDIKLKGKAKAEYAKITLSDIFGVKPDDFEGLIPRVAVKPGDHVSVGTELFHDKEKSNLKVVSPVSGEVVAVNRGDFRKLLSIEVKSDGKFTSVEFPSAGLSSFSSEEVKNLVFENGFGAFIRRRPYDVIASPEENPVGIFISAFDSAPLAPDYDFIYDGDNKDMQTGIDALKKMTGVPVHVCVKAGTNSQFFKGLNGVELHEFDGPHPAGLVGVQINHINPINKGDIVWTVKPDTVISIGHAFNKGVVSFDKSIAVTGSEVKNPTYVKVKFGAKVDAILNNQITGDDVRIISGNVLTGTQIRINDYLCAFDNQITVIPETKEDELLGWIMPRCNKFSINRTYFSWLCGKKEYALDTNINGGERAIIVSNEYDKVFPMDIYPEALIKAVICQDIDKMIDLGIYEVAPEDFALCEFVDTSKLKLQKIVREGLNYLRKEEA